MKATPNPLTRANKDTKKHPFLNPNAFKEHSRASDEEKEGKQTYTALELVERKRNEIPMLVESLIPQIGLLALTGTSDVGKSQLLRQLAIDVARNDSFLDFKIYPKYRKVLLICTEDDPHAIGYSMQRQSGSEPGGLENIRICFDTEGITDYLDEQLADQPADLVIVDTWGDVYVNNLNDANQVRQSLNAYRRIALKHGCAILFLHHTGKNKQNSAPSKDNILGSQGFEAKMRLVMELVPDKGHENIRHLCIVKGNYLPPDMKKASLMLEFDQERFTFKNTQQRRPYKHLAKDDSQKGGQFKPDILNRDEHHQILCERVFPNGCTLKLAAFRTALKKAYEDHLQERFGGQRLSRLQEHLMNVLQLVKKEGKDRSPNAYYYLATDHPTNHGKQSSSE